MAADAAALEGHRFGHLQAVGFRAGIDPLLADPHETAKFARENSRWLARKLSSLRGLRSLAVAARYRAERQRKPLQIANREIAGAVESIKQTARIHSPAGLLDCSYQVDGDDDQLKEAASRMALQCSLLFHHDSDPAEEVLRMLHACGIEHAKLRGCDSSQRWNWQGRALCERWWLRQLRAVAARRAEQVARELHAVNRISAPYVSPYTMARWVSQQHRNQAILARLVATNSDGQQFSLEEIAARGQANPVNRRNELMVRIRGFEEYATANGHDAHFITVTCPSRYHQYSGNRINPNYNGSTPREAAAYLQGMWARCRAALHRTGVRCYGFRIAEPHHDGCPHWHLLLFSAKEDSPQLIETMRDHAMRDTPDEPGAAEHRFTAVAISAALGTAAGYIAKYVSKNVDGFNVGRDHDAGAAATATAPRVRAWASTWGIRQFQQIGGPPVTVYRELRRAALHPDRIPPEFPLALVDAADQANWAEFTRLMGGANLPRKLRPARIWWANTTQVTMQRKVGRYGEHLQCLWGIIGDAFACMSRFTEWSVAAANRTRAAAAAIFTLQPPPFTATTAEAT